MYQVGGGGEKGCHVQEVARAAAEARGEHEG
jgi:hypothetical protein